MQNEHMPGHPVVRGPMGQNQRTEVHNLLLRGQVIPPQYVGVWGYIVSNTRTSDLNAITIARDLNTDLAYIEAALHSIECAGLLIRAKEGWFVTDLPLQLRNLGVTDADKIQQTVQGQFIRWFSGADEDLHGDGTGSGGERDLVADVVEVLGEQERVRATDVASRLRTLAPTYRPYADLGAEGLKAQLNEHGVKVAKADGILTVRAERVRAELACRDDDESKQNRQQALSSYKKATRFIYAIGESGSGLVKIGLSFDTTKRLKQLQSGSPSRLTLLWRAHGGFEEEQALHERFAKFRVHGEWFDFGRYRDPVRQIQAAADRIGVVGVSS